MRRRPIIYLFLATSLIGACKKGESTPPAQSASKVGKIPAYAQPGMSGCDHDVEVMALAKHAWPYPADARNVQWGDRYQKMKLKLRPNPAAFFTATVTWKDGQFIEVLDSQMVIRKPRKVVANQDLYVTRKVWDQGIQVQRKEKVVAAGEVADFLFYNSRGLCLIQTKAGPGWTPCSLDGTFEGVTAEEPFACEQFWWMKVRKSRVDQGWLPFEPEFMNRLPPGDDATK